MKTRFTAWCYPTSAHLPQHELDYYEDRSVMIVGRTAREAIGRARAKDIYHDAYMVERQEWKEICPGDGLYDWISVSTIDPFTMIEEFYE